MDGCVSCPASPHSTALILRISGQVRPSRHNFDVLWERTCVPKRYDLTACRRQAVTSRARLSIFVGLGYTTTLVLDVGMDGVRIIKADTHEVPDGVGVVHHLFAAVRRRFRPPSRPHDLIDRSHAAPELSESMKVMRTGPRHLQTCR